MIRATIIHIHNHSTHTDNTTSNNSAIGGNTASNTSSSDSGGIGPVGPRSNGVSSGGIVSGSGSVSVSFNSGCNSVSGCCCSSLVVIVNVHHCSFDGASTVLFNPQLTTLYNHSLAAALALAPTLPLAAVAATTTNNSHSCWCSAISSGNNSASSRGSSSSSGSSSGSSSSGSSSTGVRPIDYIDYSVSEHLLVASSSWTSSLQWWEQLFEPLLPVAPLSLPFDRNPTHTTFTGAGGQVLVPLPPATTSAMEQWCQSNQCSFYMVLLATVSVLLLIAASIALVLAIPLVVVLQQCVLVVFVVTGGTMV